MKDGHGTILGISTVKLPEGDASKIETAVFFDFQSAVIDGIQYGAEQQFLHIHPTYSVDEAIKAHNALAQNLKSVTVAQDNETVQKRIYDVLGLSDQN